MASSTDYLSFNTHEMKEYARLIHEYSRLDPKMSIEKWLEEQKDRSKVVVFNDDRYRARDNESYRNTMMMTYELGRLGEQTKQQEIRMKERDEQTELRMKERDEQTERRMKEKDEQTECRIKEALITQKLENTIDIHKREIDTLKRDYEKTMRIKLLEQQMEFMVKIMGNAYLQGGDRNGGRFGNGGGNGDEGGDGNGDRGEDSGEY